MDMTVLIGYISQMLAPLPRLTGFFLMAPFFGSPLIPKTIKVLWLLTLSIVISPSVQPILTLDSPSALWVSILSQEILLGVLMGFIIAMAFQVFILMGQLISLQAGLGFATMVEPSSKSAVPLISQWYLMMVTLLFLSMDGHLALIQWLNESFQSIPMDKSIQLQAKIADVIRLSPMMFSSSLVLALPAVLALLMVNMCFGIMTRVAPQLNIYTLGFPITLLMGFVMMGIQLNGLAGNLQVVLQPCFALLINWIH